MVGPQVGVRPRLSLCECQWEGGLVTFHRKNRRPYWTWHPGRLGSRWRPRPTRPHCQGCASPCPLEGSSIDTHCLFCAKVRAYWCRGLRSPRGCEGPVKASCGPDNQTPWSRPTKALHPEAASNLGTQSAPLFPRCKRAGRSASRGPAGGQPWPPRRWRRPGSQPREGRGRGAVLESVAL